MLDAHSTIQLFILIALLSFSFVLSRRYRDAGKFDFETLVFWIGSISSIIGLLIQISQWF